MIFNTLIISLIAVVCDVVLKKAAMAQNYKFLLLGMFLYSIDAIMWFWVYKSAKFSTVAIVYSIFTIFLSIVIGFFFFKEKINFLEIVGIILGIGSILILGKFTS
jgi:drug/metabolite transporter (DMT)-like permease